MKIQRFEFRPADITVFENDVIRVFVPCKPHTHAEFGGHLVIQTKNFRSVCTLFTPDEAIQVMAMTQACTEYMLHRLGAVRTNNQDNGNWFFLKPIEEQAKGEPRCHIHIYGRSPEEDLYSGPGAQKWGKSLDFPLPTESAGAYPEPVENEGTWLEYIHPYSDAQIAGIKRELPDYFRRYLQTIANILK